MNPKHLRLPHLAAHTLKRQTKDSTQTACRHIITYTGNHTIRQIRSNSSNAFPHDVFSAPKKKWVLNSLEHDALPNNNIKPVVTRFLDERQIMSGPTIGLGKERALGDQKMGNTKLIFKNLNQLKENCIQLLSQNRNLHSKADPHRIEIHLSDTADNTLSSKLTDLLMEPVRENIALPDININQKKVSRRAAFNKIFSAKLMPTPVYKVRPIQIPSTSNNMGQEVLDRRFQFMSPTNCTTKNKNITIFNSRAFSPRNGCFLDKVIIHNEMREKKVKLLKMTSIRKVYDPFLKISE